MDKYQKSIALLKQLVQETSKEELSKMVKSAKDLNIEGPTYMEYLDKVQSVFGSFNWNKNTIIAQF